MKDFDFTGGHDAEDFRFLLARLTAQGRAELFIREAQKKHGPNYLPKVDVVMAGAHVSYGTAHAAYTQAAKKINRDNDKEPN